MRFIVLSVLALLALAAPASAQSDRPIADRLPLFLLGARPGVAAASR